MSHAPASKPAEILNARTGALWAARRGLPLLPVKPNSKNPFDRKSGDDPVLCGGVNIATMDLKTIEAWFAHNPAINYGIAMGRGLVTLDCDADKPTYHHDYLNLKYPHTLEMESRGGGTHVVLRVGFDAGQAKLMGAPSIDVRARGGFIVGPGSVVNGKRYRLIADAPIADCPPELAARISRRNPEPVDKSPMREPDQADAMRDGWGLVASTAPASEPGRNTAAHALAGLIKRLGVSQDACAEMVAAWGARCTPPLDEGEVRKAVQSSYDNGNWRIGEDRPDGEFEDVSAAPELAQWERRRLGVPEGALTEGSADIDIDEIVKWRVNALVKGILHPGEQAVLYADPGAGKSFAALDLAWHIAQGKPWHGRKVARVPVLYVALEGVEGFRGRIKAAEMTHGEAPWFRRQKAHVSLIRDKGGEQGMATVLAAVKETAALCGAPVGLIVIDTLARAMDGDDENSAKDVMHFVDHRAGEIARKTGAAVLTVAHTNKLGTLRGSLTLSGAVNVVLKIERDGDHRTLVGEKIKDGDEVVLFGFSLRKVHLATDSDGDAVESCVIVATPADPATKLGKEGRGQQVFREAYRAVSELAGKAVVPLSGIREAFHSDYPADGETDPDKLKESVGRAWRRACKAPPRGLQIRKIEGLEHVGPKGATDITEEFSAIDDEES